MLFLWLKSIAIALLFSKRFRKIIYKSADFWFHRIISRNLTFLNLINIYNCLFCSLKKFVNQLVDTNPSLLLNLIAPKISKSCSFQTLTPYLSQIKLTYCTINTTKHGIWIIKSDIVHDGVRKVNTLQTKHGILQRNKLTTLFPHVIKLTHRTMGPITILS